MIFIFILLSGESAQALLTIKNGGFYGSKGTPSGSVVSSDMESVENENGEEDFMNENSNDSRPGFLSALGLHPAGKNGANTKHTPEKKPTQLYNRRGTVSWCHFC